MTMYKLVVDVELIPIEKLVGKHSLSSQQILITNLVEFFT
ncbi:hypothetical protein Glo7428_0142 [Gloeocapsa sp. PCC 7428]|nr:hypothetical protein Glo7428_0142 [Gloeocapsa sp. PCC 7428]